MATLKGSPYTYPGSPNNLARLMRWSPCVPSDVGRPRKGRLHGLRIANNLAPSDVLVALRTI